MSTQVLPQALPQAAAHPRRLARRGLGTFPQVSLPSHSGGLPVEVVLIAQLGIGHGDELIAGASHLQRGHSDYIDALDEPSARIGAMDLARGDTTSLYSFAVDAGGHPFHRHAGHRVFTAVSGSAGAQLRFSTASQEQIDQDPAHFIRALRHVNVPPDCLFTVRFGGGTWHQFVPLRGRGDHPALFALSCHTNELGGDLPDELRAQVQANRADIPSLTDVLPASLHQEFSTLRADDVPTVALSLHAAPGSRAEQLCAWTRDRIGRLRGAWGRARAGLGFLAFHPGHRLEALPCLPAGSLLGDELPDFDHEDAVQLVTTFGVLPESASVALEAVLDGFLAHRPAGVTRLMQLRNALVKPFGLRTSPLGCPVSSLLANDAPCRFAARYPALREAVCVDDRRAQVILGADDRHLQFRSCVEVRIDDGGRAAVTLATRVRTRNVFGRFYMAAIARTHRRYIAPTMLRMAVEHAARNSESWKAT